MNRPLPQLPDVNPRNHDQVNDTLSGRVDVDGRFGRMAAEYIAFGIHGYLCRWHVIVICLQDIVLP